MFHVVVNNIDITTVFTVAVGMDMMTRSEIDHIIKHKPVLFHGGFISNNK